MYNFPGPPNANSVNPLMTNRSKSPHRQTDSHQLCRNLGLLCSMQSGVYNVQFASVQRSVKQCAVDTDLYSDKEKI